MRANGGTCAAAALACAGLATGIVEESIGDAGEGLTAAAKWTLVVGAMETK